RSSHENNDPHLPTYLARDQTFHGYLSPRNISTHRVRSLFEELITNKRDSWLGRLRYLYMGTSNVQKDVDYYTKVLGAKKIWDISSFGTRVAALRLGEGPFFLLADHRPAPSCIV